MLNGTSHASVIVCADCGQMISACGTHYCPAKKPYPYWPHYTSTVDPTMERIAVALERLVVLLEKMEAHDEKR